MVKGQNFRTGLASATFLSQVSFKHRILTLDGNFIRKESGDFLFVFRIWGSPGRPGNHSFIFSVATEAEVEPERVFVEVCRGSRGHVTTAGRQVRAGRLGDSRARAVS